MNEKQKDDAVAHTHIHCPACERIRAAAARALRDRAEAAQDLTSLAAQPIASRDELDAWARKVAAATDRLTKAKAALLAAADTTTATEETAP